jgi:TrmH family RNA methyltransferase
VQEARKLLRRVHRDRQGRFLLEGPRALADALEAGAPIREVFATEVAAQTLPPGYDVTLVGERVIRFLTDSASPQGVVAVAEAPNADLEDLARSDLSLILAGVRDPGNAGTLVRSAAAAGAGAVVFTEGSVDPLNPKTVRACAGALFSVPVVRDVTVAEAASAARAVGIQTLGADVTAGAGVESYDLTRPTAFVLGNEAWGFEAGLEHLLDGTVRIEMPGRVESLNVGIAGSILLFEAVRTRSAGARG